MLEAKHIVRQLRDIREQNRLDALANQLKDWEDENDFRLEAYNLAKLLSTGLALLRGPTKQTRLDNVRLLEANGVISTKEMFEIIDKEGLKSTDRAKVINNLKSTGN